MVINQNQENSAPEENKGEEAFKNKGEAPRELSGKGINVITAVVSITAILAGVAVAFLVTTKVASYVDYLDEEEKSSPTTSSSEFDGPLTTTEDYLKELSDVK